MIDAMEILRLVAAIPLQTEALMHAADLGLHVDHIRAARTIVAEAAERKEVMQIAESRSATETSAVDDTAPDVAGLVEIMHHLHTQSRLSQSHFSRAADALTVQAAEIAHLRIERDAALNGITPKQAAALAAKEAECAELRHGWPERLGRQAARIVELEAALRDLLPPELDWKEKGNGRLLIEIRKDDLRNARAALSGKEPQKP